MKHVFTHNGQEITYNYTVNTTLFGTVVENILIKRTCDEKSDEIQLYSSWSNKVKLKLMSDTKMDSAYKTFNATPEQILKYFPVAYDLIYHKNSYDLCYDLSYVTELNYEDYVSWNKFSGFSDSDVLCLQIESLVKVAHEYMDEYERLKKSRFIKVIRKILKQQRHEQQKATQAAALTKIIIYGTRLLSICTTGNDTGGDVAAAGAVSISDVDFPQWLDSIEIDGQPDLSPDEKMDYLMQEGDDSDVSFTGHTAGSCDVCSCTCFRPVKSGDNSTSALCECGHTCAQHKWS